MNTLSRPALIAALSRALHDQPEVDAAWEGGSAAFDSDDGLSDVDAVAIVADDAQDAVFAAVQAALEALSPLALRVDVDGSVGYRQTFYRLRDAGEFLVVDLVLLRRSDPVLFREVELHGQGRIWFDRRGVLVQAHVEPSTDAAAARARVPVLRDHFLMFQHIPTKERLRGRAVEALSFYQAMTLRPLIEALRLLHCPQRRGFSVRYLARDLPADVVPRFTALSFVRDLDDLAIKHDEAQSWFADCITELERSGPGCLPGPANPMPGHDSASGVLTQPPA